MTAVKAKRGDLVALVYRTSWQTVDGQRHEGEHAVLAEVAGITRDGLVRTARDLLHPTDKPYALARLHGLATWYVLPAPVVGRGGLIDALHDRPVGRWERAKFASLDECREFVRPFRLPAP